MKFFYLFFIFAMVLAGISSLNVAYAQFQAGGVDLPGDPSWFVGEGLKKGDFFSYSLCHVDYKECAEFKMDMWIKGDTKSGTEDKWLVEVVVYDGNKVIKGEMELGKLSLKPSEDSNSLGVYQNAFKSSIVWLSAFANGYDNDGQNGPKKFSAKSWGKIGNIGGEQILPTAIEKVTVPAGTYDTVLISWKTGGATSKIWVVDNFPFPIKAQTYTHVSEGIPPPEYRFELLKYNQNITSDPFSNIHSNSEPPYSSDDDSQSTPEYDNYSEPEVSVLTTDKNTYRSGESVILSGIISGFSTGDSVQVNLVIKDPADNISEPKGTFSNTFATSKFNFSLPSSLFRMDGIYSAMAYIQSKDSGKTTHFGFFADGTEPATQFESTDDVIPPEILIPSDIHLLGNNPDGLEVEYSAKAIDNVDQILTPECSPSSDSIFPVGQTIVVCTATDSSGNSSKKSFTVTIELVEYDIPPWVKDVAGFWCSEEIDDPSFIQAVQYLISSEVIVIPTNSVSEESSDEIPKWIKNNACWWSQEVITDGDFVNAIQYLIEKGIIMV